MLESPLTFFRGATALMAHDIGPLGSPGLRTQIGGDCHLGNFGGFASPERALLFGINDFDETLPGAFEWDVKRLSASFVVAARERGVRESGARDIAFSLAACYREHLATCAAMPPLELWYQRMDFKWLNGLAQTKTSRRQGQKTAREAEHQNSYHAFPTLVEMRRGQPRIRDHAPLIYHSKRVPRLRGNMQQFWRGYVASVPDDRRVLLDRYELVDVAVKVVGVGSVGTRCIVALLMATDRSPLFLQFKEASRSVWEPFAGACQYANHGQRVVAGQHLMQPATDIFLGWSKAAHLGTDFYIRQLRDMKVSLDVTRMGAGELLDYARACAMALAWAHAKSGDAAMISGYLGNGDAADHALANFAVAYADQTERDHETLVRAHRAGRIRAVIENPA